MGVMMRLLIVYLCVAYRALKPLREAHKTAWDLLHLLSVVFGQPNAPFLRSDLFETHLPDDLHVSRDELRSPLSLLIDFPYTRHSYILFNIKQAQCQ
jgi:hypothetical protein